MHPSVDRVWNRESAYRALLLLTAAAIGVLVVRQSWLYLAALLGLCLVTLWPVQSTLGIYALLVPFDSILVLGSSDRGTTLTFVIGGLAIAVLLATGIGFHRLAIPPRAALWWMLFILWGAASAFWAYEQATVIHRFPTMFSMFRGALLALVTMVIVYLVKLRLSWRVFVPVMVLVVALLFSPKVLFKRVEKSEATGGAGRLYIWQAGIAAFRDYGLAGAGLDNFYDIYDKYAGTARKFVGLHRDPHNIYLQTGVELGAVGLGLLAFAIASQVRRPNSGRYAKKAVPSEAHVTACQAAAWGMLTASFFLGMLWIKAFWLVWTMLSLAYQDCVPDSLSSRCMPSRFSEIGRASCRERV